MPATLPGDKPFAVEGVADQEEVFVAHEAGDLKHAQEKTMRSALPVVQASGTHYLGERCVEIPIAQKVTVERKIRDPVEDASFAERDNDKN